MGAHHFVLHEEEEAFADWINKRLAKDKDTAHFLPLSVSKSSTLYQFKTIPYLLTESTNNRLAKDKNTAHFLPLSVSLPSK